MTNQFDVDSLHSIAKDKLAFITYLVVQEQHGLNASYPPAGDYQLEREKRLDAVNNLLDSALTLFCADSGCDMSSAADSLQRAARSYPELLEDPGYDENGSL